MTVYIAVCDDNIADRKHIERLLNREKDERYKKDGDVLYIESFGSSSALIATPVKYDLFIIDLTFGNDNGMNVAKALRAMGIIAPIVLLSSSIDYKSFGNSPEDVIYIDKPVVQGQISHLFDIGKDWAKNKPSLLEIRGKNETCFLPHKDLIRAVEKTTCVEAAISDGRYIEVPGNLKTFMGVCSGYKCFVECKKSLINIHHINEINNNPFLLDNGESFEFSPFKIREILEDFVLYVSAHK